MTRDAFPLEKETYCVTFAQALLTFRTLYVCAPSLVGAYQFYIITYYVMVCAL